MSLPPGWSRHEDPAGRTYLHNSASGETRWLWTRHKDPSSNMEYMYNNLNGERLWIDTKTSAAISAGAQAFSKPLNASAGSNPRGTQAQGRSGSGSNPSMLQLSPSSSPNGMEAGTVAMNPASRQGQTAAIQMHVPTQAAFQQQPQQPASNQWGNGNTPNAQYLVNANMVNPNYGSNNLMYPQGQYVSMNGTANMSQITQGIGSLNMYNSQSGAAMFPQQPRQPQMMYPVQYYQQQPQAMMSTPQNPEPQQVHPYQQPQAPGSQKMQGPSVPLQGMPAVAVSGVVSKQPSTDAAQPSPTVAAAAAVFGANNNGVKIPADDQASPAPASAKKPEKTKETPLVPPHGQRLFMNEIECVSASGRPYAYNKETKKSRWLPWDKPRPTPAQAKVQLQSAFRAFVVRKTNMIPVLRDMKAQVKKVLLLVEPGCRYDVVELEQTASRALKDPSNAETLDLIYKDIIQVNELVTQTMILLDHIDVSSNATLRSLRKSAVSVLIKYGDKLDHLKHAITDAKAPKT